MSRYFAAISKIDLAAPFPGWDLTAALAHGETQA